MTLPQIPAGTGKHPVIMVVIAANQIEASAAFYAKVFGWQPHPLPSGQTACLLPAGASVILRGDVPEGFQGMVPIIAVPNVELMLERIVAAGGSIERAPWTVPMAGTMARFKDPSGTIYGLTSGVPAGPVPPIPWPMGSNPKPLPHTVCSMEMYAANGEAAAGFFQEVFGWGFLATMPHYMSFDPGAGAGGVWQSHTPTLPGLAYIYVADVTRTLADVVAAGGKASGPPMPMAGFATFGYFVDPSGTHMGLIGPS